MPAPASPARAARRLFFESYNRESAIERVDALWALVDGAAAPATPAVVAALTELEAAFCALPGVGTYVAKNAAELTRRLAVRFPAASALAPAVAQGAQLLQIHRENQTRRLDACS